MVSFLHYVIAMHRPGQDVGYKNSKKFKRLDLFQDTAACSIGNYNNIVASNFKTSCCEFRKRMLLQVKHHKYARALKEGKEGGREDFYNFEREAFKLFSWPV